MEYTPVLGSLFCDITGKNCYTCHNRTINPFVPNAPFLYTLKTPENRKVFCFQGGGGWGVEKGCIRNEWVKILIEYIVLKCFKISGLHNNS